ncbi:MAG: hypothetical protein KC619_33765, partial [Myxococcales bacterium]|nr:hypothetical protein [Myxococcales bacterium]
MSIAPYIEGLEAELLAASEHLPTQATADEAQLALERAGDALRAGLSLPTALSRWNLALGDEVLAGAFGLGVEVLADLVLPGASDSHLVDVAAVARDRVESLLVGARHACIVSGRVVEDLDGHGALLSARASVDEHLRSVVTRQDLEAALGERRAL